MRLLLALAACAALVAGCGSSDDNNSAGSGSSSDTTTQAAPAASSSGGAAVKLQGFAFSPKSLTVKKGQKVTWTNEDSADHNVTSKDGTLKSPDFGQGKTFTYTATKPGTFNYICTIHPQMQATLIVTG